MLWGDVYVVIEINAFYKAFRLMRVRIQFLNVLLFILEIIYETDRNNRLNFR